MGAYLSSPATEKISSNGKCDFFVYGASSMQGWRMSQEDAHNCLVDFDKETETSLFAVYDGHGGAEVAQYTAAHFPDFLKSSEHYLKNDLQTALEEGFLDFDGTLVEESVIKELKEIAGLDDDEGEEDEVCMPAGVGRNEADVLRAEANMPLEQLLEKYENYTGTPLQVRNVKKKEQILSPVLKPKRPPIQRQQDSVLSEADSNSNSLSDINTNSNQSESISSMCSFDQKIANGCADNENNLNFEKEFMEKNKAECLQLEDSECNEAISVSCNKDVHVHKSEMKSSVSSSSDSRNNLDVSHNISEEQVSSSSSINPRSSESKDQCDQSCSSDIINSNSNAASVSSDIKCEQIPSSSSESGIDRLVQTDENNKLPNSSAGLQTNGHPKNSDLESLKEPSVAEGTYCSSDSICEKISEAGPSCSSVSDLSCSSELKHNGTEALPSGSSEPGPCCSSEPEPCGSSEPQPSDSLEHELSQSSEPGPSSSSKFVEEAASSGESSTNQIAACSSQEEPGSSGTGTSTSKPSRSLEEDSDESIDDEDDDYEDSEEYIDESDEDDDDDDEDEVDAVEEVDEVEDNMYRTDEPGSDSGCTAVVALIRGNQLIVANAGDSRCVLSRKGNAVDLSFDHKPEDEGERKRIEAAGGNVTLEGRVNGGLNLSRAIGDHCYKQTTEKSPREQMITALPDIESCILEDTDEFVVMACDGIWNYMSSQEVVDYVRERLKDPKKRENPALICEELFDHCLAPNTTGDGTGCDNMTCIILTFHKHLESNLFDTLKRKSNDTDVSQEAEDNPEKKSRLADS